MSELTIETARAVIAKGIEHGAWSWDDPADANDDAKVLKNAQVTLAASVAAGAKGIINDAVFEILHAAGLEPTSDVSREAYVRKFGQPTNGASAFASQSQPLAPSEAQGPGSREQASAGPVASPEAATEAAPAAGEVNIDSIFPGYDDLKVADIKKAILFSCADGSMTPEEWEQIKLYESSEQGGQRKTILDLQPEFKAPEPDPAASAFSQPVAATASSSGGAFTGSATKGVTTPEMVAGAVQVMLQGPNDGDTVGAFYNGETISRAQQEGLLIPQRVQFEQAPDLPIKITDTGDKELSEISTALVSYYTYAQWLQSQEEGRERAAEHLEHEAHRDAYVMAYENHKSAIPEGKSGPTALDAARKLAEKDADGAEQVSFYRSRKIRHGIDARELKALAGGYDKKIWRITEELERRARLQTTTKAAPR